MIKFITDRCSLPHRCKESVIRRTGLDGLKTLQCGHDFKQLVNDLVQLFKLFMKAECRTIVYDRCDQAGASRGDRHPGGPTRVTAVITGHGAMAIWPPCMGYQDHLYMCYDLENGPS